MGIELWRQANNLYGLDMYSECPKTVYQANITVDTGKEKINRET